MTIFSHLKSFQALELAVRLGSLKSAAEALSITPAAVGQRIKALEDYLGVDLVIRGRSGLSPSPELSGAMEHLRTAFRALDAAADHLDLQRTREIHIAAHTDFVKLWLEPRLDRFRTRHPNVRFCINGEGDAPMRLGQADCEIRFGAPREDSGIDFLFHDYLIPVLSPENTARISKLDQKDRLEGFPLLHLDFYKDDPGAIDWPEWIKANAYPRTAPERGIRFQRVVPALEAVLSDAGLMIGGLALLSRYVDEGHLSLPFPISTGRWTEHGYQARFRSDALAWPQVRLFRAFLAEESRATNLWLTDQTKRPAKRAKLKTD